MHRNPNLEILRMIHSQIPVLGYLRRKKNAYACCVRAGHLSLFSITEKCALYEAHDILLSSILSQCGR